LISLGDVLTKSKVQTNELLDLGIEKHIITRGLQQLMFSLRSLSNKSFIDDFDYSQFSQMIDVLLRELSFLRRRLASDLAYESSKNLKGIKDRETQIKDLLSKTEAENHKARESFSVILGLGNQIA
jgi:D-alanyl-D-alanine dipeptidase